MPVVNWVKFMRGTQATYDSLIKKDKDTLYFVYEDASATKGRLYLGNKLISGSSSFDDGISLADISDVIINSGISSGDILVYNEGTEKWESMPLTAALDSATMIGASASSSGLGGFVPTPEAGDQDKFLRGDATWAEVPKGLTPEDEAALHTLQDQVSTLVGEDTNKSVSSIVTAKVTELLVPGDAQEGLDTLREIAEWIQNHPDDAASMNSNITILQEDVADLQELINGTVEHPETGLVPRVNALETSMGTFVPVQGKYLNVGSAITYLNNSVTTLTSCLQWHELGGNE